MRDVLNPQAPCSESFGGILNREPPPIAIVGNSLDSVGTPALLVDLDAFEFNLQQMAALARRNNVALRPHAKAHKSTAIAKAQINAGAVGVCCQKLSEAYSFAAAGVKDIFISNEFVGDDKLVMALELAACVNLSVCVDHTRQIAELGSAARKAGVKLTVLAEIDVGQGRCGVTTPDALLALLDLLSRENALSFGGLQAYHGGAQHQVSWKNRQLTAAVAAETTGKYLKHLDARGISCPVVTGGGTGTAEFDAASGVYTEIQPGSYIFMDAQYGANLWEGELQPRHSLFIASTIMSTAKRERVICDVGLKGVAVDAGLPILSGWHPDGELKYVAANDEHGILEVLDDGGRDRLGDRIYLIPGHCDPTANLYRQYVCFRKDKVEAIWEIEAHAFSQ